MHILHRDNFSLGWQPNADAIKGPAAGYLRGDNVLLDEVGIVSLRLGSHTINPVDSFGAIVPIRSALSQVHSLFTATINGTRNQFFGVTDENGLGVAVRGIGLGAVGAGTLGSFGSFDGTGDIQFGSFEGQVLAARGTTHWKNDGTNTRTWGIAGPVYKPTCTVLAPRVLIVSSFDGADQSTWISQEDGGLPVGAVGNDGLNNGALEVTPASTTGRATVQKVFTDAQNFNSFDAGAATGALEDSIEFYARISNPGAFQRLSIAFDVNPNSPSPFQDDYYFFEFAAGDATDVVLTNKQALDGKPDLQGPDRDRFNDNRTPDRPTVTRGRDDKPAGDTVGWSKFVVLRGQMQRVGATPGCDWSTVKAVQFTFSYDIPTGGGIIGTVRLDNLRILGGSDRTLTGKYQARYVWARDFGNYVALSPPSPISDEIECRNGAIIITEDPRESVDGQVKEVGGSAWGYLAGGTMGSFYRFNTAVGVNLLGVLHSVVCTTSERDAIISDITLESDLQTPPNNPVAIIGPHFNRMIVLTSSQVYIGIEGNPDGFRAKQVLDLADPSETIKWGIKTDRSVLIGTTKDIYRLSGSLALLPDNTTDASLEPAGIESPPVSEFVVQDGGVVVYLGSDGFRMLSTAGSVSINWNLDLLVLGYTRHGVSLSLSPTVGRLSGAIYDGRLYVGLQGSNFVYVANLGAKQWRREQYPNAFARLYRELDGGVVAGDSFGRVWQLSTQDSGDKVALGAPASIPVVWWSVSDSNGEPLQYKEPFDWRAEIDTGGAAATVDVYLDEAAGPSLSVVRTGLGPVQQTLGSATGARSFRRVQQRISGNFNTFKLAMWSVTYRERPVPMLYWDSSLLDFGTQDLVWFRELKLKIRAATDLRVRVVFDGLTRVDTTLLVSAGIDTVYSVPIGPEVKGRLPLVIVEPSSGLTDVTKGFELYWMYVKYKGTGEITERKFKVQQGAPNAA